MNNDIASGGGLRGGEGELMFDGWLRERIGSGDGDREREGDEDEVAAGVESGGVRVETESGIGAGGFGAGGFGAGAVSSSIRSISFQRASGSSPSTS